MDNTSSDHRYSIGAMIFHWVIAVAVIWNWRIAESAHDAATREESMAIMANHKALGIAILVLTIGRLIWRFTHRTPGFLPDIKPWERRLASAVYFAFYALLIGLPLFGWLANSYYGQPIDFFGWFTIPALPVAENGDRGRSIYEAHATAGTVLLLLVALHILGALKHQFIDRDGEIYRMLPWGKIKS